MEDVPFEEAKTFCEKYQKDQCVILSWDKESGLTWVTTFGVGDENSKQAANAGKILKDYLKIKRDNDEIPKRFEDWVIESVDRYYYFSSRYSKTFVETTFWFERHTTKRKETVRNFEIGRGEEWKLPDWARSVTEHRKSLDQS